MVGILVALGLLMYLAFRGISVLILALAIQNAIPMPLFGTTPFAAPGLGILTAMVIFVLGNLWLSRQAARARSAGEGYGAHADALPAPDREMREHAESEGFDIMELQSRQSEEARCLPFRSPSRPWCW